MNRIIIFGCILALVSFFSGCYLVKQGAYLLHYQRKAENIQKLLERNEITVKEKEKLLLVEEIKSFAVKSLGLDEDKNYTRYTQIEKEYLVDVVSAAEKDAFRAYTWKYPIVGEVPYKGFYVKEDALRLAKRLKRRGYDVMLRQVDAFSTLGYFADPIFSFMLDYREYVLADLIIHEQTHSTLFLKDEIQFNEELAMFMGTEGALLFLKQKYGDSSNIREEIKIYHQEQKAFFALIEELYNSLDIIYSSSASREEKLEQKEGTIANFKDSVLLHYDEYFVTNRYKQVFQRPLNNAHILSLRTYTRDLSLFYQVLERFEGNLHQTFKEIRKVEYFPGDPKEYLKSLVSS